MYQLIVLFRPPSDPAAFDRAYWDTHIPLARKIPGVVALDVSKFIPGKDGKADYYQLAVLSFTDKDSFKTAMKSTENAEAGANLMTFAQGLVEFFTAEKISPEPPHVNVEERI
jgi:uncharacterized protein (TIGR02118 family)